MHAERLFLALILVASTDAGCGRGGDEAWDAAATDATDDAGGRAETSPDAPSDAGDVPIEAGADVDGTHDDAATDVVADLDGPVDDSTMDFVADADGPDGETPDDAPAVSDTSADVEHETGDTVIDADAGVDEVDVEAASDAGTEVDGADEDAFRDDDAAAGDGDDTADADDDAASDGGGDTGDVPIECAAPLVACLDGDGVYRCVDLEWEHCHCGACGNRCATSPCWYGGCFVCGDGGDLERWCAPDRYDPVCMSGASDVATLRCMSIISPVGCLACGVVCAPPNAFPYCAPASPGFEGGCSIGRCNTGWDNCDGSVATGCETDILNSPTDCGECDRTCPALTPRCVDGHCTL